MRNDVFAVDARAGHEVTEDEARVMLQSLLEDRFKLVVHMEQREMRYHALVLANADGKLGPYMNPIDTCTPAAQAEARKLFPPRTVEAHPRASFMSGSCTELSFMEMSLTQWSDIPVLNKTGLTGKFTYDMRWVASEDLSGTRSLDSALVDALKEQLGLTVRPHQERAAVIVVDSMERPSQN